MKNKIIKFAKILLAVACCYAMLSVAKAEEDAYLPFRFVYNGDVKYSDLTFPGYSDTDDCPSDHTDPDGHFYWHMHTNQDFTFPVDLNFGNYTTRISVTKDMSDEAWAIPYDGYAMVSRSTTAYNCYAYAIGAPTPTYQSAWSQWTAGYTLCSGASKQTSTLIQGGGHCVVFKETAEACLVEYTIEKYASGPVWSMAWYAPFDYLPEFSSSYPIGQNLQ